MTVQDIVDGLQLEVLAGAGKLDQVISGGYAADLLSNVMGQASLGSVWVTMQGHQNIIAVASLLGLSAVIVAGGAQVDAEAIAKAESQQVVLLSTAVPVFEVVGRLYAQGIRGL